MTDRIDYASIHARVQRGETTYASEAEALGLTRGQLRGRLRTRLGDRRKPGSSFNLLDGGAGTLPSDDAGRADDGAESQAVVLSEDQVKRITSLEDLIQFFKVDTNIWMVRDFRINKWEQNSDAKGVTPLYQVRANLVPRRDPVAAAEELARELYDEALRHLPPTQYAHVDRPDLSGGDPVLLELAIHDPHIGMLAWKHEVGDSYDSDIAVSDYSRAVDHTLAYSAFYPVERILYVVGHDLLHVDGSAGPSKKGGATASGTVQDIDSRLAKMFTAARRAVISGIDRARLVAPVDVVVVPGNHDTQQMYRMGEVLAAWYRNDPEVNVVYGANKRKYYAYGKNAFLLTHGEEYRRQRDNLALIFATEAPASMWAHSTHREVHTGHNHIGLAGRYHPTSELTETRSIRVRSLAGLTPEDAWHHEEGYKHRRTASVLAFRKSGGLAGIHEFNP